MRLQINKRFRIKKRMYFINWGLIWSWNFNKVDLTEGLIADEVFSLIDKYRECKSSCNVEINSVELDGRDILKDKTPVPKSFLYDDFSDIKEQAGEVKDFTPKVPIV